jgi:hypothetical protein
MLLMGFVNASSPGRALLSSAAADSLRFSASLLHCFTQPPPPIDSNQIPECQVATIPLHIDNASFVGIL